MKKNHQYNFDTMMEFVYSTNDLKPDPCSDFFINFASSDLQETLYSIDSEKDKINFSDQSIAVHKQGHQSKNE